MELEANQYTPDKDDANAIIHQKLRKHFDGKIVRKDLTKAIKEGRMSPSMSWSFCLTALWL